MTGIDHRTRRPSPAVRGPKINGKEFPKVRKLQKLSVPQVVPLACPAGCALVPADLLQQLQSEVSKTAKPVLSEQVAAQAPHPPRVQQEPAQLPHEGDSHSAVPVKVVATAKAVPKPLRAHKDAGVRPIVLVKHAGVSTDEVDNGLPPPPGARHASVGTVNGVEEGTQTTPEEEQALPADPGPDGKASPSQPAVPPQTAVGAVAQQPLSPDKLNSTDHGRCDLFGMDRFTAEKDRDRKRLQAQMLAEQIQEQRERKEEELRRKREEEVREDRRLAKELREIEERHRHEQAVLAGQADAQSETPKAPSGRGPVHGQARRRKSSKDLLPDSPTCASSYTQLRADSSAGPWGEGERRVRRRRRRRDATESGQDSSWRASERDKRTWRDANYLSHSMLPDGRDTHSQSPVPWMTSSPQDGEGPDGLHTVLETEQTRTEARRRRRPERVSDRDRREIRERGDSYDANDTWESAQNRRGQDQDASSWRADGAASWARDEDDEQSKRRPGRAPARRGEQLAAVAEVPAAESPRQPKQPPSSDADLREQIESLVKVCEQLLRERAEERQVHNPRTTPVQSPTRKTQERQPASARQSPSPRRLPASSKQEFIEDPPRTGMSGAALGSARGASQANKASRNPTGTGWRSADAGTPAAAAASDMHTWGEKSPEVAQPSASGGSNVWPADSLSELLQGQSRMIAASEIPEAHAVSYNPSSVSAAPAAVHPSRVARPPMAALVEESPFASPARGIAVRRSSRSYRRDSYGGGAGWDGRMLASPPLISRGGLNVQANWEPLGLGEGGGGHPFHKGSRRSSSKGPGQVPIGINPSIQAQSAMLREMYPNVAMGGPGPGPLARG